MTERREFVRMAAGAVAASALAGCGSSSIGGLGGGGNVTGTFRAALPAVGGTVGIPNAGLGGQGIAVTRLTTTTVVAVSRQCTHQGCTINLPGGAGANLSCPCHGSAFQTTGAVVNGPAASPLHTYAATIDTGTSEVVVVVT